jgi:hypothetical protein
MGRSVAGRAVAVVAILLAGLLPVGCTPSEPPPAVSTALILDLGQPTLLFRPCGGSRIRHIDLRSVHEGSSWRVTNPYSGGRITTRVRLLRMPTAWQLDTTRPDGFLLTALTDRGAYVVSVRVAGGPAAGRFVMEFTLAGLRKLHPDAVWAPPGPSADARAMSRAAFREAARLSCEHS